MIITHTWTLSDDETYLRRLGPVAVGIILVIMLIRRKRGSNLYTFSIKMAYFDWCEFDAQNNFVIQRFLGNSLLIQRFCKSIVLY